MAANPFVYSSEGQLALPDARSGSYYVVCRDGDRTGWLLGPYADHSEAIERVASAKRQAEDAVPRAWAYTFCTARIAPGGALPARTVFGR